MNLSELKILVAKGEGENLEFKLKANHPDKIVREMVAFANASGGKLLLGISDDLQIKGTAIPDEEEFVLTRAIEKYIKPTLDYTLERVKVFEDKEVLVFDIKESHQKPVCLLVEPEIPKVFVRKKDKSIQASKEVREILKGKSKAKNLRFQYGEKENLLMKFLNDNEHITLKKFSEIANISPKIASRTLILLVLTNVLDYTASDHEDLFFPIEK